MEPPLSGEISKLLGKENVNLRFKIVGIKKKMAEKKISKLYLAPVSGFLIDTNTRLFFLKIINLVKKLEKSYKSFFFERNLNFPRFYPNIINFFLENSEKKILKISILVKRFRVLFFHMKEIFKGSVKFLFSVQNNVSCLKNFIKELITLDIIGKCGKKYSIFNKKIIKKKLEIIQIFKTNSEWGRINELKNIINQKKLRKFKNFSLVIFKNINNMKLIGKKKETRGSEIAESFEKPQLFLEKKLRLIKKQIQTDYVPLKKMFCKNHFFFGTSLRLFDKTISDIILVKKTKKLKIENFKSRQKILVKSQYFSKVFSNKTNSFKKNDLSRSPGRINFPVKKYCLENSRNLNLNDKNHGKKSPKNLDLLTFSIFPKIHSEEILHLTRENKFYKKNRNIKGIQKSFKNNSVLRFQTKFFFPKKNYLFSRITDLDRELLVSWEKRKKKNKRKIAKKKFYLETKDNQKKINILFSVISSFRKKQMVLQLKMLKKIKTEQQIKNRLLEIKGMEADFSEIISLMKQKK